MEVDDVTQGISQWSKFVSFILMEKKGKERREESEGEREEKV